MPLLLIPDWVEPVARYMLETGLPGTLRAAGTSLVASTLIGVTLGTLLTIRFLPTRSLIRLYIEVWRGLPIIVTLFVIYFGAPQIHDVLEFDPLTAGIITLTLWGSAQIAEATRGAVQSIPTEQHEASAALGFGWLGRHAYVILPQALRRLLPPLVSLLVGIVLNTTLIQVIGGTELLESAEQSVARLSQPEPPEFTPGEIRAFEIYGGVMVLFFLMSFPLTRLAGYLERRLV